jgi:hypothetical protein
VDPHIYEVQLLGGCLVGSDERDQWLISLNHSVMLKELLPSFLLITC